MGCPLGAEHRPPGGEGELAAFVHPALEQREGGGIHAHGASTVAFAVQHHYRAGGLVDVLGVKGEASATRSPPR